MSRYQRTVNWKEVKEMQDGDVKIGFVFIKATEGIGKVDDQFGVTGLMLKSKIFAKALIIFLLPVKAGKSKPAIL